MRFCQMEQDTRGAEESYKRHILGRFTHLLLVLPLQVRIQHPLEALLYVPIALDLYLHPLP